MRFAPAQLNDEVSGRSTRFIQQCSVSISYRGAGDMVMPPRYDCQSASKRLDPRGSVFLDVGAHIGFFSLFAGYVLESRASRKACLPRGRWGFFTLPSARFNIRPPQLVQPAPDDRQLHKGRRRAVSWRTATPPSKSLKGLGGRWLSPAPLGKHAVQVRADSVPVLSREVPVDGPMKPIHELHPGLPVEELLS